MLRQLQVMQLICICIEGDQVLGFIYPPAHLRSRLEVCGVDKNQLDHKIFADDNYNKARVLISMLRQIQVIQVISKCLEGDQGLGLI